MFSHVAYYPGDTILGLVEKFVADPRAHKVSLSVGVYFDENGKLPVLQSVRTAEIARAKDPQPRNYLPMEGLAEYRQAVQKMVFGQDSVALKENRVATIQAIGGAGSIKIGADFIKKWFPHAEVYISDPTWDNHRGLFEGSGFKVNTYPYYDQQINDVKFDEMIAFLKTIPAQSVVVLHPCCHNPTGVDLSQQQWDILLEVMQTHQLIPFMDMAYQGFGDGFEQDAYAVRKAVDMGMSLFVCNSFSKNLSLYGERVGGLSVVCPSAEEARLVFSQLKAGVRRLYTSPPTYGGVIAANVINNPELFAQWTTEVAGMRNRIKHMRQKLYDTLNAKLPGYNFDYLIKQRGMFSYTGLSSEQVQRLQNEYAIYLLNSGRICIGGLNDSNIEQVAEAFAAVLA